MMNTLEQAVAEQIARDLRFYDADVQPQKGRVVVWVDRVPFALNLEQLSS